MGGCRRAGGWLYTFFFFQAEDGIRDLTVTGVQTCALPISAGPPERVPRSVHQRAVSGVRVPRDAARGGRPLRRARLHRLAAHARDRAADGADRKSVV